MKLIYKECLIEVIDALIESSNDALYSSSESSSIAFYSGEIEAFQTIKKTLDAIKGKED